MPSYLAVALLDAPYATYTYAVPPWFQSGSLLPGQRVLVPLGRTIRVGVIVGPTSAPESEITVKNCIWPLETHPMFGTRYMDMAASLATRQSTTLGKILGSVVPSGLRTAKTSFVVSDPAYPKALSPKALRDCDENDAYTLAKLWAAGLVRERFRRRRERQFILAADPPWPVRPSAQRQLDVLEYLYDHGVVSKAALTVRFGTSIASVLARLVTLNLVRETESELHEADWLIQGTDEDVNWRARLPQPTEEQTSALNELVPLLEARSAAVRLVHGVTGSGKTRLYMELVARTLQSGRQVLLLAPEVALAGKLWRDATVALSGFPGMLYHGSLSPTARQDVFSKASKAEGSLFIVGARSALFLPLSDIGLIILDEEHDTSFKQDERLPYQAKELAWFLAQRHRAVLVLGSATPDLKTYYAAKQGAVPLISLKNRVHSAVLPEVELVTVQETSAVSSTCLSPEQAAKGGPLAERTVVALRETIEAGDQAVIMLNRRGYAPVLYCSECEETVKCPECELSLTYHKKRERLICHYCGLSFPFPKPCPTCGGCSFVPMGEGTELLQEQLPGILPPNTSILRLDRDSARRPGRAEEILAEFGQKKAQILVGTQMLSKGHHFPDVTLAIAVDGDMGRNLPDFRAAERAFQLLVQMSGRAGRGDKPGRVLLQTRNPVDPFWQHVLHADYERFYEEELEKRRKFLYPPFVKLGLIRLDYPKDWEDGSIAVSRAGELIRQSAGHVRVLGPVPAPLPMVAGRRRFNCLLKAEAWPDIRHIYTILARSQPPNSKLKVRLDLDPVDML